MSDPDSVAPDERLRLFVAFPLPRDTAERLAAWRREEFGGVHDARLVPVENLHVTLAFLGSTPRAEIGRIASVLRDVAGGASRPVLSPTRYRETRSVGMVVLDDEGGRATTLAGELGAGLERLGVYRRERRPWLPHVTVLRFRRAPRLDPSLPDLGRVSPSEVALYHSVLRPNGAQHEIIESAALRA
jgi:RNA 2',3'-cyclic 3'-phosphodiesterase